MFLISTLTTFDLNTNAIKSMIHPIKYLDSNPLVHYGNTPFYGAINIRPASEVLISVDRCFSWEYHLKKSMMMTVCCCYWIDQMMDSVE